MAYATWAASRGAASGLCRFTVPKGKLIIEAVGLDRLIADIDRLPSPNRIDMTHRKWRVRAIHAATKLGVSGFTHGVAAKLINLYLKAAFVCGGMARHPKVRVLHPPIDSVLLDELYYRNVGGLKSQWIIARRIRWSKFDSVQYEAVITAIRQAGSEESANVADRRALAWTQITWVSGTQECHLRIKLTQAFVRRR